MPLSRTVAVHLVHPLAAPDDDPEPVREARRDLQRGRARRRRCRAFPASASILLAPTLSETIAAHRSPSSTSGMRELTWMTLHQRFVGLPPRENLDRGQPARPPWKSATSLPCDHSSVHGWIRSAKPPLWYPPIMGIGDAPKRGSALVSRDRFRRPRRGRRPSRAAAKSLTSTTTSPTLSRTNRTANEK